MNDTIHIPVWPEELEPLKQLLGFVDAHLQLMHEVWPDRTVDGTVVEGREKLESLIDRARMALRDQANAANEATVIDFPGFSVKVAAGVFEIEQGVPDDHRH